jgi:hypothetical protein
MSAAALAALVPSTMGSSLGFELTTEAYESGRVHQSIMAKKMVSSTYTYQHDIPNTNMTDHRDRPPGRRQLHRVAWIRPCIPASLQMPAQSHV